MSRTQLNRWRRVICKPKRKGGRPTCSDAFSRAVLNSLMFGTIEKEESDTRLRIVANVAYGYDIIKHAAREAQKLPAFANDRKVQGYKFSSSWVRTWVKNMKLRRREGDRVLNAEDKVLSGANPVQNLSPMGLKF